MRRPLAHALDRLLARLDALSGPPAARELRAMLVDPDLSDEALMDGLAPHCSWEACGYTRNLVRESEHYQLFAMCWGPGQRSSIHDHAGSACGLRVVRGDLTEIRYRRVAEGVARREGEPSVFEEGSVCVSYDADIHVVANLPTRAWDAKRHMVSMHVYTPPLNAWNCYAEQGAASAQRV